MPAEKDETGPTPGAIIAATKEISGIFGRFKGDEGGTVKLVALLGAGTSLLSGLVQLDTLLVAERSSEHIPQGVSIMAQIVGQMGLGAIAAIFVVFLFGTRPDQILKMTALALVAGLSYDKVIDGSKNWLALQMNATTSAEAAKDFVVSVAGEYSLPRNVTVAAIAPDGDGGASPVPDLGSPGRTVTEINTALESYWASRELVLPGQRTSLDESVATAISNLPAELRDQVPALQAGRIPGSVLERLEP